MLLEGVVGTLRMSSLSMVFGLSLGIVFMLMRMSKSNALRALAIGYIELIRNTPILVQVFFVFFGMPAIGIRLSGEQAAILAMTLNCAAYAAEIVRGGVQSIRPGQIEAGRALGLHTADIYRFVVFRPAIRAVYPALCNQFILMMLNSSLVSSVSAEELTYFAQTLDSPDLPQLRDLSHAWRHLSRAVPVLLCRAWCDRQGLFLLSDEVRALR